MKTLLKVLVAFFAVGLSASAAYFSVLGLTKMFAGAVLGTAIVCSFIEGSKLIIASVLHQFSKSLNFAIKGLLTVFLILAMAITSMGVYGYLTNAFQSTANQLEMIDGQTSVLNMKRQRFQESLDGYVSEKKDLAESITELTKGLSNNVIEYKDKQTGEIIRTTSSSTRRTLEKQLEDTKTQRDKITLKVEALTDSVTRLDIEILNLNSNEDLAAEIGPLKFITKLTGFEMDQVVNFLTLILVLIIDPLAIVLVIVFNNISKKEKTEIETSVPEGMEFNTPYPIPQDDVNHFEHLTREDLEPENSTEVPKAKTTLGKYDLKFGPEYTKMMNELREEESGQIESNDVKLAEQFDDDEDYPEPNQALTDAAKRYKELMSDETKKEQEFYGEKPKQRPKRIG